MRKKRFPAALVAMMAVGLAIAGATARPAPSAELSTTEVSSLVADYLATGVLPTDVTGDPGVWNFAGPTSACPGPGWNCVTLGVLPITQVGTVNVIQCVGIDCVGSTQTGYANTFECPPGDSGTVTFSTNSATLQACGISQAGDHNQAKCIQKKKTVPFVRQRCSITQTGQDNQATIVQVIDQTGVTTQGAVQEAGVSQTATASKNQLQVDQEVKQYTETGDEQDQDAYQVVTGPYAGVDGPPTGPAALQTAAGAGDSAAQINQKQNQREKGGTTQTQNDGITTFAPPPDCHDSPVSPEDPNLCSNLEQTSGSGDNQSQLTQTWDVEATTSEPFAFQKQGAGKFIGGDDGRVHQVTMAPGFSQGQATQSEVMRLFAPPDSEPDQFQFGGAGCCGFGTQIGPGTQWLDQKKDLDAVGGTFQSATLVGTLSTPAGTCGIDHDVQTNSDQATESASSDPCIALAVITTCENSGGNGDPEVGQCQDTSVEACEPGETPFVEDDDEDGVPEVNCVEPNGPPILT